MRRDRCGGRDASPPRSRWSQSPGPLQGGRRQRAWIRVARLDALEPGKAHKANVIGSQVDAWTRAADQQLGAVWLIKDSDSHVRAYSVTCPHLGCAIELANDHFNCPCHDSSFGMNGQVLTGPSPRGMDPLDVRIEPPWVSVRFVKYRQGVGQRVPA